MHRSVLNVVTNAIDAASQFERSDAQPARVSLSIDFSQLKNYVRIHVIDNGSGIAEEDQARIFSPFESTKGARGTGLGLPVSQKILREHGGDISIESSLGGGTTFSLHWPAYRDKSGGGSTPDVSEDWGNRATL
jgi:two-component system NtrC family sensor kinase